MTGEILFLAHRMPFPPDRGDRIRSSHVLTHLASIAPVHVATFAESAADLAQEARLASLAASHCLVRRTKPLPLAGAEALLRRQPVSLAAFGSNRLRGYVERTLRERPVSAVYVFSGQMGQYVPGDFKGRVIMDFVDVDSAKFDAYARQGAGARTWIDAREGRLLRREEGRLALRADRSLLVSPEEAALFVSRLDSGDRDRCDVSVLRNGIDCAAFDPACVDPEPALAALPGPRLIFTGQMDYAPNVAAAERAINRLMPLLREAIPEATFHVVGRNPPERLRALQGRNGSHVWGEVADIRPWLRGADLALIPLDIARGVQNKVLEAMAMALPVILTRGAATGIGEGCAGHLAVAESDAELVGRAVELLGDPPAAAALGQGARAWVAANLGWHATLAPLAEMLGTNPRAEGRHAA